MKDNLKVLIGCLNFSNLTGSELHVYELAKELNNNGCDVSIYSNCGGDISKRAKRLGIKLYNFNKPPGYRYVNGQFIQNQPIKFDILHLNHLPIAKLLTQLYPNTKAISTIHSEVISLEHPLKHKNIKKYIAIRPEIKNYIVNKHGIPENDVEIIYNPFDINRFTPKETKPRDKKRVLFVGTLDYLRKEMINDLIKTTKEEDKELWIIGAGNVNIKELIGNNTHVIYYPPTWNVEKYIQQCDETAGILLGRTTIEGWLCGKNGWIYDINDKGEIQSKTLHNVPKDLNKFNGKFVADKVIEQYKKILL
jgi:glycosyltransferase involved in cell wall biosynthesis